MTVLLIVYLVFFSIGNLALYVAEIFSPASERDPIGETIVDLFTSVILIGGMLFLLLEIETSIVKQIWRVLTPMVVIFQLYCWGRDLQQQAGTDLKADRFANIFSGLLILPAAILNLIYAFS